MVAFAAAVIDVDLARLLSAIAGALAIIGVLLAIPWVGHWFERGTDRMPAWIKTVGWAAIAFGALAVIGGAIALLLAAIAWWAK